MHCIICISLFLSTFNRVLQNPIQSIPDLSPECTLFLNALLNRNPDLRPTCEEALNMTFMKSIEKIPATDPLLITPIRQPLMTDLYQDMLVRQFYQSKKKPILFRPLKDRITEFQIPDHLPKTYSDLISPFLSNISSEDSFRGPVETVRALLFFFYQNRCTGNLTSLLAKAVVHSSILSPTLKPIDTYFLAIIDLFKPSYLTDIAQTCLPY